MRRRKAGLAAGLALAIGLLAGCQSGGADGVGGIGFKSEPAPDATAAVSIANGAVDVSPRERLTITATGGKLTDISVLGSNGAPLGGTLSQDDSVWTADSGLDGETSYTVAGNAENADGKATPISSTFATLAPRDIETAAVVPANGETVGVAMPIVVHFDAAVVDRAEAERQLVVTANPPQEGSWAWLSDREAQYRTRDYWQPGTQVTVNTDLRGVEFENDIWGVNSPEATTFTVGRKQIVTVDIASYTAHVEDANGQVIRSMPVSNGQGRGEYATREGHKVIMTRQRTHTMVSPGRKPGDPGYYSTPVSYALRVTNTGEFLHAAPWSVWAQGSRNVSHGCTNLSTDNARWLYENTLIGDPAIYTNGIRDLNQGNGWAMWNISYDEWKQGSALNATPEPAAEPSPSESVPETASDPVADPAAVETGTDA